MYRAPLVCSNFTASGEDKSSTSGTEESSWFLGGGCVGGGGGRGGVGGGGAVGRGAVAGGLTAWVGVVWDRGLGGVACRLWGVWEDWVVGPGAGVVGGRGGMGVGGACWGCGG